MYNEYAASTIALNGFALSRGKTGLEVYTSHLAHELYDRDIPIELYSCLPIRQEYLTRPFAVRQRAPRLPGAPGKLYWNLAGIAGMLDPAIQILHSPIGMLPARKPRGVSFVVTLLDFAFRRCPQYYTPVDRAFQNLMTGLAIRMADRIICISESTRRDLTDYYPAHAKRSVVVHLGYNDFAAVRTDPAVLDRLGLTRGKYFLSVGAADRKNAANLCRAFASVRADLPDYRLVIGGGLSDAQRRRLTALLPDVILPGRLDDGALKALYEGASAAACVSFYEGFGFPVLEALACGTAVVAARTSSYPEVTGYPGDWLVDPAEPADIGRMLRETAANEAFRARLLETGRKQLPKFSWGRMAEETIAVYRELRS